MLYMRKKNPCKENNFSINMLSQSLNHKKLSDTNSCFAFRKELHGFGHNYKTKAFMLKPVATIQIPNSSIYTAKYLF